MVRLDPAACRERLATARVAHLATAGTDGRPHLVPVTFAVVAAGDGAVEVVSAVDHKPKTTRDLRRLRNLAENPRAALLCDHYDEDWGRLWWVRADGAVVVEHDGAGWVAAIDALAAKYVQYRQRRPDGPVLRVQVERLTGWAASR